MDPMNITETERADYWTNNQLAFDKSQLAIMTEDINQRFIDCIDALEIIQDDLLREAGGNCCFCGVHSSEHGFDCATIKL
jgi:hypothetical protein